ALPGNPDRRCDLQILGAPAGGDAIVGKPRMRLPRAAQGDGRVLGACRLRVRKDGVADLESLVAIHHYAAPVLSTFTLRKRAGGQPWLTALVWPGSPLPSADVPHSLYVDGPPRPSHDAQKSGVRD